MLREECPHVARVVKMPITHFPKPTLSERIINVVSRCSKHGPPLTMPQLYVYLGTDRNEVDSEVAKLRDEGRLFVTNKTLWLPVRR